MTTDLSNVQLHFVDNLEKAMEFKRWLGQARPLNMISIDIETGEKPGNHKDDALSPWHGKIRLMQVGDSEQGWAIPWEDWAGVFYEAMADFNGPIVCHNIAFEAKWMAVQSKWKMPWHNAHDTMIMSQIIKPNRRSHGLKPLTAELVDSKAAAMQAELDNAFSENGWTWGTVPVNFKWYWMYGALDPVITTRLALEHFYKYVQPGAVFSEAYELEMAVRKIATTMEINGARVDLEYSQKKLDELQLYTESVKAWGFSRYNASITSNIQMVKLFESLGGEITQFTPSGGKSVNKDQIAVFALSENTEVRTLAETILKQRQADKLASSYFSNFISDQIGGVLHPSINIMAARTSRMSITKPALQTLPAGDAAVRRAFVPRHEGEVLITSDLDQVEFRLTACFSEDPALIELFHEADRVGGDVFTSIMRQVYHDNTLVKSDHRRKLIKGCVPLDSEILTRRGWLTYDQVAPGDETLGYNIETGRSEWTTVEGVHTFDDSDIYKLSNGHKSFLCTEDHRWIADNGRSGDRASKAKIIHADEFIEGNKRLILAAGAEDGAFDVSDSEARLLGWILGDGSIKRSKFTGGPSQAGGAGVGCAVEIYQTKAVGEAAIDVLAQEYEHTRIVNPKTGQVVWSFHPDKMRDLLGRAQIVDKNTFDPWALAAGLTLSARNQMIRGLDEANGKNKTSQKTRTKIDVAIVQSAASPVAELVVALGYLTGQFARQTTYGPEGSAWTKNPYKVVWHQPGRMTNQRASLEYVETGSVWCVTTGSGTWTMRQKDKVPVLTGNTVYGKLYGAGVDKMAATSGVSFGDMKEVVDAFDNNYPGVKRFQKQIENEGAARLRAEGEAYVLTKTGRKLPADDDRIYSLTNYKIQATAAEVFKQNLVKLDKQGLSEYMVVPVHDEIVLSVPEANAEDIKAVVKEAMTSTEGWVVPLTAGVDGPFKNWGESYE